MSDEPSTHSEPDETQAFENTDRELWRDGDPEDGMSYYEPSIHVTEQGGIGINVGGTVYVKTLREWHGLVEQLEAMRRENEHMWWFLRHRTAPEGITQAEVYEHINWSEHPEFASNPAKEPS